jgi:competence protein ComEC
VLLVPHHGSNTSSTEAFIDRVAPRYALFQVGYKNRYGHPSARVLARYTERDIEVLRTDHHGMITLVLNPQGELHVHKAREEHRRYWRLVW